MKAAIVIVTRNRSEELRRALRSAVSQRATSRVLVIDDGSTDDTSQMVRSEFPDIGLERSEVPLGCIVQRNRAARLVSDDVIVSVDDDAEFSTPHVVEQVLSQFDDERIGVIAIPYKEPVRDNSVLQQAPSGHGTWITDSYVGTAHALRRALFLQTGGYRPHFVHQGEERDFSIRLLAQGYVVRLGHSDVIVHHVSARRNVKRMHYYGRRNDILYAWHNVPSTRITQHLIGTSFNGLRAAWRVDHSSQMALGMLAGYVDCLRYWKERSPVETEAYLLHRRLRQCGPIEFAEIRGQLPAASLSPVCSNDRPAGGIAIR